MAQQDLAKFAKEYLTLHPELKAKINAITDQNEFVAAMREAGARAGFDFSADDVRNALAARHGELSEDQLDGVAGGVITLRKSGGTHQEY
jgi:predicted ribosomally synthesized peptide with nif11-like leader